MSRLHLTHHDIRPITIVVIVASLLLSVWGVWADNVINNDGVEYVRAARFIQAGDFGLALEVFKWPAFPALMALVSSATGLSPEYAAHVLNAIFTVVLILAYLATVIELGADRRTVIAAAVVILLAPRLNDYRPFVIRDPGYLAFYTLSMLFFFRYIATQRLRDAVKSVLMMLVAIAFRMEGFAFLVLIPLLLGIPKLRAQGGRLRLFGAVAIGVVALVAGFLLWFASLGGFQSGAREATSLVDLVGASLSEVSQALGDKLHVIEVELLGQYSADYAPGVLIGTLLMIVGVEVMKSVSIWTGVLIVWAWFRGMLFPARDMLRPWVMLLGIHCVVLLAFTLVKFFLTERYSLALTVTLLLAAPFGLLGLYELWRRNETGEKIVRFAYPVLVVLVIVAGIEGLGLFTEKNHIKDAGRWIATNSQPDARLMTNSKILAHYAERDEYEVRPEWFQVSNVLRKNLWRNYDYLAIRVGRRGETKTSRLLEVLKREPVKSFENARGDQVLVFKTGS